MYSMSHEIWTRRYGVFRVLYWTSNASDVTMKGVCVKSIHAKPQQNSTNRETCAYFGDVRKLNHINEMHIHGSSQLSRLYSVNILRYDMVAFVISYVQLEPIIFL